MKRGEIWWADLGAYRAGEQTGRRPVIVWQSDTLTRLLQSVLVVPLTTNLDRAKLAGTALISATDGGLPADSVALAFQMRAQFPRCVSRPGFVHCRLKNSRNWTWRPTKRLAASNRKPRNSHDWQPNTRCSRRAAQWHRAESPGCSSAARG